MFGTSGVRGDLDELPPERYVDLGGAIGRLHQEVVVGRDARLTGEAVFSALRAGLASAGCRVVDVGRAPTHLVAYAARKRGAGGVVVTASHNPPEYNGVKLFEADGAEASEEREQEVVDALDGAAVEWRDWASRERAGVLDGYVDDALDYLGSWTTGDLDVEVAVDVGNGVAGRTTVPLLRALGADVVPVNAQEDGRFPSRPSEPRSEVVGDYVEFVEESGVDLGFAHDGDGDRLVVVDDGGVVSEDGVVAVLARETLERSSSDVVVTTPNTSRVVDRYVENAGGVVERVALGGLAPAVREHAPAFAAEPWKPVFPDWGPWVDGSVAAAVVACLVDRDPRVFDDVRDASVERLSVACPDAVKQDVIDELRRALPERFDGDVDLSFGVAVESSDGWFLVRPSGTEPLVRVYGEASDELLDEVREAVVSAVSRAK